MSIHFLLACQMFKTIFYLKINKSNVSVGHRPTPKPLLSLPAVLLLGQSLLTYSCNLCCLHNSYTRVCMVLFFYYPTQLLALILNAAMELQLLLALITG